MTHPSDLEKPRTKRRMSRRAAAIAVGMLAIGTPAGASLLVENFMEASITAAPACFNKVAGGGIYVPGDADDPQAEFDGTNTTTEDGVLVTEELLTIRGMVGDRVTYTRVVEYKNDCDIPLEVSLVNGVSAGTWAERTARVYISKNGNPADLIDRDDATDAGPVDLADSDDWVDTYIEVDKGGVVSSPSTTVVTIPPGESRFGAISITSSNADTGAIDTINWTAQAVHTRI